MQIKIFTILFWNFQVPTDENDYKKLPFILLIISKPYTDEERERENGIKAWNGEMKRLG